MGKPTGFLEYERERKRVRWNQRNESKTIKSSMSSFQKKNSRSREHAAWIAVFRSASQV